MNRRIYFQVTIAATVVFLLLTWLDKPSKLGVIPTEAEVQAVTFSSHASRVALDTYRCTQRLSVYLGFIVLVWSHAFFWPKRKEEASLQQEDGQIPSETAVSDGSSS